ncbi:MAG TPA: PDZ domain-containing protein [Blastocatellia bacterium]|nr:PDZ domain-containing protein [Blastocatellia bacterium]
MIRSILLTLVFLLALAAIGFAQADNPLLLQKPTLSRTQIAFAYAGDLWIVNREGGEARRLTTGPGVETDPIFSPDGKTITFTGEYDGNVDVYAVAASGGVPRRLTYHPGPDMALGWTPDGKQVLFSSTRNSSSQRFTRFFTISAEGGFPTELPLPMGSEASYAPDGSRLAYVPLSREPAPGQPFYQAWKRYRGGLASPIWIANLSNSHIEKVPRDASNDFNPMWVEDKVYFLSDRNGTVTLFAYETSTKKVTQLVRNDGLDMKSASAGPGAIVYEQFGGICMFDLKSATAHKLDIRVAGDLGGVRARFEKIAARISTGTLSPTGARAVFEARGEIITVPGEKGDARNLTNTPGAAERDPSWSPDGRRIAYFSDESGEYELHLRDQSGMGPVQKINLGASPSFYYSPTWSPDSKKIAYTDKRLNLWYVQVDGGTPVKVDTNTYENPFRIMDPTWSPDSRWITYTKQLKNRLGAVFIYSLESGKSSQITDGLSDARFACFDKNGKYLYFTASTDIGPTTGWLDMSSFQHPVTRSVYVVVLRKDLPSPLAPESDEEKIQQEPPKPAEPKQVPGADKVAESKETVAIDFENISQRILALPIPAKNYQAMLAGKTGTLFILESPPGTGGLEGPGELTLHKFDLEKRKVEKVLEGATAFDLSATGEKMLYRVGPGWFIAATSAPAKPGEGALKLDDVAVYVDPRAEWDQMYHEVWRIERDFFYDPGYHGLDLKAAEKKYKPYLANIAHRADLNYLFREMLGELSVGHLFVAGGDVPEVKKSKVGLLGADYRIENGRYRFARIYNGENWNPQLRAPLTQPGVNVQTGEYLLAVNGRNVDSTRNVYSFFEETAGKSVVLRVGSDPSGANSREVTVVPVESETGLRNLAWIEDNRRKVDQMSGGKLAYVYLPDTAGGGYTNFNRYYFAQINKEGAVIDERFNGGGTAADYIIDYMRRPLMNYWMTREGEDFTTPVGSIYGPKVMVINEYAGSGGDLMPWLFRRARLGPLIGKRTWGGLVGIYDYPQLIDGGVITAPRVAFWSPDGTWDVENHGVAPDIEVEFDPEAWRAGRDPQLEKAVEVVMEALKKNSPPAPKKPAYPNYHK